MTRSQCIESGQRWRQFSTGREYVVTKVGARKATFERQTEAFSEKATVFIDRLLRDSDWTLVAPAGQKP